MRIFKQISTLTLVVLLTTALQSCGGGGGGGGGGASTIPKSVANKFTSSATAGYYKTSDNLDITLAFPSNIIVSGTPSIQVDLGGSVVTANYISGDGTNSLIFRYVAVSNDLDTDGIEILSPISLNGGSLKYNKAGSLTDCPLDFTSLDTSGVLVDAETPSINTFTPASDGLYLDTQTMSFSVEFTEAVNVTGVPRLVLDVGGSTLYAEYDSGDGTDTLVFNYTVGIGDQDLDGISVASPIDLNSGSIQDDAGNNADLSYLPPSLPNIKAYGKVITVALTTPADASTINRNNDSATFVVNGTCSESGQTVVIKIDGANATSPTGLNCDGTNFSGTIDTTGIADGARVFKAELGDGVITANSSDKNITKDTVDVVTINAASDIDQSNETEFLLSGTCTYFSANVSIVIGSINKTANCSAGTWSTGPVDVSTLADGTINITADHGNATQATTSVTKDTSGQVVTITSAPDISISNQTIYIASGTCSDNGQVVTVDIGGLSFTPSCGSGTWTTGQVDVSSLLDGSNISLTADHSTASQASTTINKATSTPTVASLSVATTLITSADLTWNLNDPGGFTINDYSVEYRVQGSSTWIAFTNAANNYTTVTGLSESTIYEFRVAVNYDSVEQSAWSNTASAETKPDDPIFGANAAMNAGGATRSIVVAYEDATNVTLNGGALITLNKGQTHAFNSAQFDVIDADKPIYTAGKIGTGTGMQDQGNIVWQPTAWAGKSFSFNATRSDPQEVYVYAIEDASIDVKQGSTVLDSLTLTAGNGGTLSWSTYGSYQLFSSGNVLAFHMSRAGGLYYDPKPLMPGHTEVIGFPSNSMRLTTISDGTNYNFLHGNSVAGSGSLNKSDVIQINPQGTGSLYQGYSLLLSADKNISGASFADSNGYCAAPFLPTNLMKTKYALPVGSDYIAFASKTAGTIQVLDSSDNVVSTLTLTRAGGNSNAPYNVRMASPAAGYRFVSTTPVAAWYQPNTSVDAGHQDESILYGTN